MADAATGPHPSHAAAASRPLPSPDGRGKEARQRRKVEGEPTSRPWRAALYLGLIAQALFCYRLTTPHSFVFDEVHYVPAARMLLTLSGPANIEHPLLGKELIALGIRLFGDTSFGWRFLSTIAGTAVVLSVFAIGWLAFRRMRTAVLAAVLALVNITIYVQARIAMLDGFMAAFVVGAIAAMLWAMRAETARQSWVRWLFGAVLLGLACGAKWAALPFVGYAGAALVFVRWRLGSGTVWARLNGSGQRHWPGLPLVPALLALGIVTALTYALTFLPAFHYAEDPLTLRSFLGFHAEMYARQTQVLPHHPYQSSWSTWPFDIRPIWYLYEVADGAQRGIFLVGNPAVLWGGLVAVLLSLLLAWRDRSMTLLGGAALWIGAFLPWAVIPKSLGFFYYYYVPSILICVPLAAALTRLARGKLEHWDEGFVALAVGLFAYFFPIISAAPLSGGQAFQHWMWFSTWP